MIVQYPSRVSIEALQHHLATLKAQIQRDLTTPPPKDRPIDRIRFPDVNPPVCVISFLETSGKYVYVRIPLELNKQDPSVVECEACSEPCMHQLMAMDELLDWIEKPEHPRQQELLQAANTQAWTHWLAELDDAIDSLENNEQQLPSLWWRVNLDKLLVEPYLVPTTSSRKPKRIQLDTVARLDRLSIADQAVLSGARWHRSQQRAAKRDGKFRENFVHSLAPLVDHPRVCVDGPGGLAWRVQTIQLNVSLTTNSDEVEMVICAGSHVMSPEELRAHPEQPRFFVSKSKRLIELFVPSSTSAKFLRRWAQKAVPIPASQQGALHERLARLQPYITISSEVGIIHSKTINAKLDIVALLYPLPSNGLTIEFRIRPIPNGPILKPGSGREDLVSTSPTRDIIRTTRNLLAERQKAHSVATSLGLVDKPDRPHEYSIVDLPEALELVQKLRHRSDVECQWPQQKWYAPTTVSHRHLRLALEKKTDWLEIHGGAQLDQQRIDLAVLVQAAQRDRGYIALGDGKFFELETTLRNRLCQLAAHLERHQRRLRVLHHGIHPLREFVEELPEQPPAGQWRQFLDKLARKPAEHPIPNEKLQSILRPYQMEGFCWLSRLAHYNAGAILADDMGLGKTLQMIAVLQQRASLGPQIVIAPTSVIFNWVRELKRFAPDLRILNYTGAKRKSALRQAKTGYVLVTSYGVIQRDVGISAARARKDTSLEEAEDIRKVSFASMVVDEAQLIKNPYTQRARSIYQLRALWKVALTGTPIENRPSELWAIFHAIFPSLLGSFEHFRTRYLPEADAIESFADRPEAVKGVRPEQLRVASTALKKTIQPYILRRTKQQVAQELPPKTEIIIDVELSQQERALYDDARLAAAASVRKDEIVKQTSLHIRVLAALTRLRQLACHPRLVDPQSQVPSSKMERTLQVLHELQIEGRRALIFSQFTKHLELLKERLNLLEIPYLYMDGQTALNIRPKLIDQFQTESVAFFLISLKAGGTGLNLTAADTVIHLDPWWNPAVEDQATDRAHRIGQTQPVTVLRMVSQGTIEQKIIELSLDKRRLVRDLLDNTDLPGALDQEELIQLILREPPSVDPE